MIISETIKEGIIKEIKGKRATVSISCGDNACTGCKMLPVCKSKKEIIDLNAKIESGVDIASGDRVIVIGRIKGWLTSWFLLAALPCIAIIGALVAGFAMGLRDGVVGTLAIGITIIYYIVLWFFRKSLNRRVEWVIADKIQ